MNNWIYENEIIDNISKIPEGAVGFIYELSNITNGRRYLGRKILSNKRTLKPLKGNKKKRHIIKESNWQTYNGSNVELLEDIQKGDVVVKTILKYCFSKKQLSYYETKYQFINNVLEDDQYYNSNILGKFFRKDI